MNNKTAFRIAKEFVANEITLERCNPEDIDTPYNSNQVASCAAIFVLRTSWEREGVGGSSYLFIPKEGAPYIERLGE